MINSIKDLKVYNEIVKYILKHKINSIKYLNIKQMKEFLGLTYYKAWAYSNYYFKKKITLIKK